MKKKLIPLNLQFFAEPSNDDPDDKKLNNDPDDNDEDEDEDGDEDQDDNKKGKKTFTQEEVNKIGKREKSQGKKAILKTLGFKSEEEAKEAIELLNSLTGAMKSDKDKLNDKNKEVQESDQRAEIAEAKLTCFYAGVNKESVDDVMAIAMNKVTDDTDLEEVLEEMKKDKRYSLFFGNSSNENEEDESVNVLKSTGKKPGHSSRNKGTESIGERLAKNQQKTNSKKSSYFD